MTEGKFYGIWNGKNTFWVHLSKALGLFTEYQCILRGTLHNIRQNLGKGGTNYQIRRLGEDGLPTGEPLND